MILTESIAGLFQVSRKPTLPQEDTPDNLPDISGCFVGVFLRYIGYIGDWRLFHSHLPLSYHW